MNYASNAKNGSLQQDRSGVKSFNLHLKSAGPTRSTRQSMTLKHPNRRKIHTPPFTTIPASFVAVARLRHRSLLTYLPHSLDRRSCGSLGTRAPHSQCGAFLVTQTRSLTWAESSALPQRLSQKMAPKQVTLGYVKSGQQTLGCTPSFTLLNKAPTANLWSIW